MARARPDGSTEPHVVREGSSWTEVGWGLSACPVMVDATLKSAVISKQLKANRGALWPGPSTTPLTVQGQHTQQLPTVTPQHHGLGHSLPAGTSSKDQVHKRGGKEHAETFWHKMYLEQEPRGGRGSRTPAQPTLDSPGHTCTAQHSRLESQTARPTSFENMCRTDGRRVRSGHQGVFPGPCTPR